MSDLASRLYGYLWSTKYAALCSEEEAKIRSRRTLDFVSGVRRVSVFTLRPLTVYDLLIYEGLENPIMTNAAAANTDPLALSEFLWMQSAPVKSWVPTSWRYQCFANFCASRYIGRDGKVTGEFLHDLAEVIEWIDKAFADSETPKELDVHTGQLKHGTRKTGTVWIANLVMRMACATGWDEAKIMDLPLGRLWQYIREIRERESNGASGINFDKSDRYASECLREVNDIMAGKQANPLKDNDE